MKKIVLTLLIGNSLALGIETEKQLLAEIGVVNTDISALKTKLSTLKSKLPIDNSFITHTELGFIMTEGNSEIKTYNLDLNLKKRFYNHHYKLILNGQYASDIEGEIANKYLTELIYNYTFHTDFSFSYINGFHKDKFSAFDYQFYSGPGINYKVLAQDKHTLGVEGNILYSVDESIKDENTIQKIDEYAAFRLSTIYKWQILESLKFKQELTYRGSLKEQENYFIFSESLFTSKINDIFSAGMSYKVDYVNQITDLKKVDTTIAASLIVDY